MQQALRKKVCILGAAAVGKTSLVAGISGEALCSTYRSTLGVRITTAAVPVSERLRELILWDIKGESEFYHIPLVYLTGCSGCIFVADGTRASTVHIALDLIHRMRDHSGDIPHVLLINKKDLSDIWEVDDSLVSSLTGQVKDVYTCSARGGITVHTAIENLARRMWGAK